MTDLLQRLEISKTIYEDLKYGRLISILSEYQTSEYSTYAVYPTNKFVTKKTQAFLEFIRDFLKPIYDENEWISKLINKFTFL